MHSQFGRWSFPAMGLGTGIGVGGATGQYGLITAVLVTAAGLLMAFVGAWPLHRSSPEFAERQARREAEQVAQRLQRAEQARNRAMEKAHRPTLEGLGSQVERILRLAEEQGNEYRSEAKRESEQILAAAQREAEEIISRARAVAGGTAPGPHSEF